MTMDAYGRGMTQGDLDRLPEVQDAVVLWQPGQFAPVAVIDEYGVSWSIGLFKGILSKRRQGPRGECA